MGKGSEETLLQEDIKIANKHMERYSALLVIKNIQIKTVISYHYTLSSLATIEKTDNNSKCLDVEKLKFSYIVGGYVKWSRIFRKPVWQFFKMLNRVTT